MGPHDTSSMHKLNLLFAGPCCRDCKSCLEVMLRSRAKSDSVDQTQTVECRANLTSL